MESMLLQSTFYKVGSNIGYYSAWFLTLFFVVLLVWVIYKYLDTSDLN